MKDVLLQLLQGVIILAVSIIAAYLRSYLKVKKNEILTKIADENTRKIVEKALDAVSTAVTTTNQTYVEALKKSGTFSVENQKEAFEQSYNAALSMMNEETKKLIDAEYGGLDKWLTLKIEVAVNSAKPEKISGSNTSA